MPVVSTTKKNIDEAATILQGGGVVSFPTETVYGLGCDTHNTCAIDLVYSLKNRPNNNPLIAHVRTVSQAIEITNGWNSDCDTLANTFWPGPLTIVLPRNPLVPQEASGGTTTIAVRCPKHLVAQKLLDAFGGPISAPSANISGHTSPTTANHVRDDFGDDLFILDGGACENGIESTVLSMVGHPTILRLGSISAQEVQKIIGNVSVKESTTQTNSPGSLHKHYAPKSKLVVQSKDELNNNSEKETACLVIKSQPRGPGVIIQMPEEPMEYAKKIYAAIREADATNPRVIFVETPPNTLEWEAIHDRLRRASA